MSSILRTAAWVCFGLEILCAIGAVLFIPLGVTLPSYLRAGRASAIMAVGDGGPSFNIRYRGFNAGYDSDAGIVPIDTPLGGVSFGPFRVPDAPDRPARLSPSRGDLLSTDTSSLLTETDPATAAEIARRVFGPLLLRQTGGGLALALLLEGLRRLFRNVARDEVFSVANIRALWFMGWALIAGTLLSLLSGLWLSVVLAQLPPSLVPLGNLRLVPFHLSIPSAVLGLFVLGLAAIFRRGLRLQEENALTI